MATKHDLADWTHQALSELGGAAHHVRVAEYVWRNHEDELRGSGDLFYTWQYDLRWAANRLRREGVMSPVDANDGVWRLARF